MKIFFTADCHFNHANIIKYCNRPFYTKDDFIDFNPERLAYMVWKNEKIKQKRINQMNEHLIKQWNSVVTENDLVYHVGDFSYGNQETIRDLENRLNGKIVHILGNHDKNNGVKSRITKCIMEFGTKEIFVQHHPPEFCILSDFAICGHVHEKWKHKILTDNINSHPDYIIINVGVDVWNYTPVSMNNVLKYFYKVKNKWIDKYEK